MKNKIKNDNTQKLFKTSTSYADIYEIVHKGKKALLFSFHKRLVRCLFFQQGLRTSERKHSKLNHSNVLNIYTWNPEYIITEMVELWNIESSSEYERLCQRDQLFSLFSYTYKNKFVHGSLHPEFLFVRPNKSLAVMGWDFPQKSLNMINTHRAPEEYKKEGGMASDLYGVILLTYELLTKKRPWESRCTVYEIQKRKCESLLRPMTAFGCSKERSNIFMKA